MEFLSLKAQNFLTLGDITLPLNQQGLVLITGVNKDAPKANNNGSGKSALFDAICWCLWGETTRGLSGDQVVNRRFQKDCTVALTFEDEGDTYIVSRHRKDTRISKPNDLLVFKNGLPLATKSSMKSMQEVVDRIVGFDFNTFCAMMPGTGVKATHMSDLQIKSLLESLLRTEQLSAAYDAARTRLKELDNSITTLEQDKKRNLSEQTALEQELERLRALQDSFETTKQEEISRYTTQLSELDAEIATIDEELSKKPELEEQKSSLREEIAQLQRSLKQIKDEEEIHRNNSTTKWNALDNKKYLLNSDISRIKKEERQVTNLGPTCEACKQAVPHEHRDEIIKGLQDQICRLTDEVTTIAAEQEALSKASHERHLETIAKTNDILGDARIKDAALKMVETALNGLQAQEQLKKRAQAEKVRVELALGRAEARTADFEDLIKSKVEQKALLENKLETSLVNLEKVNSERKLCAFWVDGFSPAGLRSFMLEYVTPILNDRAKVYSEILTDGEMHIEFSTKTQLKSGDVRDKFQILVKQEHGSDLYKGTSTGERARADLVISMTLGDLAAFRTAKQLPWRFLDEPFESIDDAGIDAIVRLLNDQKARYKTVFVVTHKSSFKQLFTQQITVVKENGISRLENENT